MTVQQAASRWLARQERLIRQAYEKGWQAGQRNYRSQYATPPAATVTTAAAQPNQATMSRVISPALTSAQRVAAQLAVIVPTAAQIAATATMAAAVALAVRQFLATKTFLLLLAVYVLWAAEQAGYAEAAHADGLLLRWELDLRADHCSDCPALATLPAMRLDQWPTLPGEGATECKQGCKCSLRSVPGAVARPLTAQQLELVQRLAARQPVLVAA